MRAPRKLQEMDGEKRMYQWSRQYCACAALLAFLLSLSSAQASETTSYSYDARGRLVKAEVSGGVNHGVKQEYGYDPATSRSSMQTVGPANPRPSTVSGLSSSLTYTASGTALRVNVGGNAPSGSISFAVDGLFVGAAQVTNGQARLVVPGLAPGSYTITATYSGDANNDPTVITLNVTVRDLSWLPAVLELLLN
jgi:hypothetical protein